MIDNTGFTLDSHNSYSFNTFLNISGIYTKSYLDLKFILKTRKDEDKQNF